MAASQRKVDRTSLRSDTQATDSTCNGWRAKRPATTREGTTRPVIRASTLASSRVLARCRTRLTRWWPKGSVPEDGRVEHQRQPGQRVPVGRFECPKAQPTPSSAHPPPDVGVVAGIEAVIEVDVAVSHSRQVDDGGKRAGRPTATHTNGESRRLLHRLREMTAGRASPDPEDGPALVSPGRRRRSFPVTCHGLLPPSLGVENVTQVGDGGDVARTDADGLAEQTALPPPVGLCPSSSPRGYSSPRRSSGRAGPTCGSGTPPPRCAPA